MRPVHRGERPNDTNGQAGLPHPLFSILYLRIVRLIA